MDHIKNWSEKLTELGFQCVNLVYRTPRPQGIPIYQTAWEDGQRAIRLVRREAAKRGYDPEKIGTISMSAGSHLALLLGTSSSVRAYQPVDKIDSLPCHINIAIVNAPAYGTTDGETGTPALREGYGTDVQLSNIFKFDGKTCPMSFHHGGLDPYTPTTSTLVYRQLRRMHIPAELHLYADKGHEVLGFDRAVEFLRQMGWLGKIEAEVPFMNVYDSDEARAEVIREDVWPEGKMPDAQDHQCKPYIEWHIPKNLKTKAIQIIYSGGSYTNNDPDGFEVVPARRYLNEKGMTVVTLKYRTPRPEGLAKHTTAWEDLQRTIRIVRSEAAARGLDLDRIGIMGSSAGGHLAASLGVFWNRQWLLDKLRAGGGLMADVTAEDIKPNGMLLCYPVITSGEFAHRGSFEKLAGKDVQLWKTLSLENQVTEDTPPAFLWHTFTDGSVPVENSLLFVSALRRANVSTEFHLYPKGQHGLALGSKLTASADGQHMQKECESWISLAATWLEQL